MKKEELEKYNSEFLSEHYEITESDVKMCEKYRDIIERSRDEKAPKIGDVLMYTNEHGDYFRHAHIDKIDENGIAEVCEHPYVPFISVNDEENIYLSTSGGSWTHLNTKDFKYVGKENKMFCDWGHCGACAHGAIDFLATVNVWEYNAESKFGEYSTKNYKKQYIHILDDEQMEQRQTNYRVLGEGNAWETIEEYEDFKKLFKGVEFDGYWGNQKVLFTYKSVRMNVSDFQYDILPLKQYVILDNGSKYAAKIARDDENKVVIIYLCDSFKYSSENMKEYRNIKLYKEV